MTAPPSPARSLSGLIGTRPGRQAAALVALALDVAALALLVALVLQRPLYTIGLVVLGAVFVALLLAGLTRTGAARRVVMALAVVAAVLLAAGLLLWQPGPDEPGWGGPAVLGLLLGGAVLQRYALRARPPASPQLFQVPRAQRVCRHPVLVVNPRSGGGRAEEFGLVSLARDLGIEVVVLGEGDDLAALARRAAEGGADALGMAGGDGSLGVVARVAIDHDVPFVCVPAGTRNHFALDLGLDRDDPRQALSAFLSGEERRIDHAMVNDRLFLNNVALGVYAAIVEQPGYREAKLETALAMLPALSAAGGPWFDLHFDVPGHGRLESAALLMVSNDPYDLRGDLGRRRRLDRGELGVITVDPQHLGDLVGMTFLAATGRPELSRALWAWDTPTFEVASGQERLSAGIDGETVELVTPLRFTSVRQGLRVLVPRGTRVGLHEQHHGARSAHSGLLEVAFNLPGRAL